MSSGQTKNKLSRHLYERFLFFSSWRTPAHSIWRIVHAPRMRGERSAVWCWRSAPSTVRERQAEWRITFLCWVENQLHHSMLCVVEWKLNSTGMNKNRKHTWFVFTRRNFWKNQQERKELENCFPHAVWYIRLPERYQALKKLTYSTCYLTFTNISISVNVVHIGGLHSNL